MALAQSNLLRNSTGLSFPNLSLPSASRRPRSVRRLAIRGCAGVRRQKPLFDLVTDGGVFRSDVPSGASAGIYEALELRYGDMKVFGGKGVLQARWCQCEESS
ncbi:hypothetical protein OPV22_006463 [Ensete ventricosum]|uniref:Enolase N-terminal domain-containing protein n=1 Tax=Ensete ventricosum TaxID=4639 RepID=A0AAV8RLE7_ENSVE|nr:hypothetical protein OPV22_006463 [Ensete ventricosum]